MAGGGRGASDSGTGAAMMTGLRRRGIFDVNEERALRALRLDWGEAYAVCFDDAPGGGRPRWRAWSLRDDRAMLTGTTPDELAAAIRAHWSGT